MISAVQREKLSYATGSTSYNPTGVLTQKDFLHLLKEDEMKKITITCHLCGETFEAWLDVAEIEDSYIQLGDGTYSGEDADHCCDQCYQADMTAITRDWYR